jgi:hypothetical protein
VYAFILLLGFKSRIAWNKKKIPTIAEVSLPIPQDARSNPDLPSKFHHKAREKLPRDSAPRSSTRSTLSIQNLHKKERNRFFPKRAEISAKYLLQDGRVMSQMK